MPEQPPPKRVSVVRPVRAKAAKGPEDRSDGRSSGYAELHCKTNFSFLEGASHPDELVLRAAELGYTALAITDRNSLAGVVRAHVAAKETGLKLLVGAEVTPEDAPRVVLLPTNRAGYGRLCRLITRGRRRAPKGECRLSFADVAEHADGLLACVVLKDLWLEPVAEPVWKVGLKGVATSSRTALGEGKGERDVVVWQRTEPLGTRNCFRSDRTARRSKRKTEPTADRLRPNEALEVATAWLRQFRQVFGDRCYALAELHLGPNDRWLLRQFAVAADRANVPLVAANDVLYHIPQRQALQDVLTAVRLGCTVAELGNRRPPNAERYLKPPAEMWQLFAERPDVVERTVEVAERCRFSLDELRYNYPQEMCPPGKSPIQFLKELTWQGARQRYPQGVPEKVKKLIEHELKLIEELHYESYFLTVWDLVRFARSRGILCQGRGSAANSAVCYCLGITSVDPDRIDVLFERFVSRERNEAPDIDVDFEHERREEVIQYIYAKYGRERAGMTAEVITYRPRSAVRDVGKALGLSLDCVDTLAKNLENFDNAEGLSQRFAEAGLAPHSPLGRQLLTLVQELIGFPRHLSQHVGGMVMTQDQLCELVPIENAAMPGRTVVQWDKDDLDALGILKVDCLALGMLTAVRKCFELIERHEGRRLTLSTVPPEDPAVYDMIDRADTVGVFQIESRAQMSMLPRLRPRCFYDLVIEVAIVRPGPIQGDMVHPYLRRRSGKEPVEYPDEKVKAVLHKTLGVPIFQEQAMRLAVVAAGFTPGEADQLRRAMGAWRRPGLMDRFRQKLIDGMKANGYSEQFAEQVFRQIRGFGEYGFPESHAASFALLVYVSAWLKHYYPAAFTAALLNSQPMGFYAPAQLVADARQHGVEVRPVDVQFSHWDCTLEPLDTPQTSRPAGSASETNRQRLHSKTPAEQKPTKFALRLGFRMVKGLSAKHAERIVEARRQGSFRSFDDFVRRTRLTSGPLRQLAQADAFRSLQLDRRHSHWQALARHNPQPLFDQWPEAPVTLPKMNAQAEVVADYQSLGLSLRGHPLAFWREWLERQGVLPAERVKQLPPNVQVKVAGLVLLRQRPGTAGGITFVTLEDETGLVNLIVRPEVWQRHRKVAHTATALLAWGHLQREAGVVHVVVWKLQDLAALVRDVPVASRNFH